MKKKIFTTLVAGSLLTASLAGVASAAPTAVYQVGSSDHVNVYVNDQQLQVDQPAVIQGGRTLVPLRAIFEALGATIQWDGATQTVTATKDDTNIVLKINSNSAKVNDQDVALDVPAAVIHDRTMVPVRFVSEALGAKVAWDARTDTVFVIKRTAENLQNIVAYVNEINSYLNDFGAKAKASDTIYAEGLSQQITTDEFKAQYGADMAQMKADLDAIQAANVPDDAMVQAYASQYMKSMQEGYDFLVEREQIIVNKDSISTDQLQAIVNDMNTLKADNDTLNKVEFGDITMVK